MKPVQPALSSGEWPLTPAAEDRMPLSGRRNTFSPVPSVKQGMARHEEALGALAKLVTAWHCQSVSSSICNEHFLVPNILEAGPQ